MMMNSNNNNSNIIMRPPGSNNGSYFDQGVIMLDDFAERVYNIFKKNFSAFMILSSIAYIIPCLPLIWFYTQFMSKLETIARDMWNNESGEDFDPDKTIASLMEDMTALNVAAIWNVLLYCVLTVIGRGAITRAVAEIYVNVNNNDTIIDWKQCLYLGGTKRFCSLLCIGFVMFLSVLGLELLVGAIVGIFIWIGMMTKFMNLVVAGILLALVIFFIGILYLSCAWMIAFPVIVIESKYNACSGFRRAWELCSGRRLTVYCTMVCYGVFQFVTNWTWQGLCFMMPTNYFTVPLRFIPGLFFLPLLAILQTVVYLNLRIDKEGMNNSVLQQDLMTVDHRSSEGGDMGGGDMVGSGGRGQTTDFAPLAQLDEDDDEEIGSIGSNKPSSAPLLSADDLPEATQVV